MVDLIVGAIGLIQAPSLRLAKKPRRYKAISLRLKMSLASKRQAKKAGKRHLDILDYRDNHQHAGFDDEHTVSGRTTQRP
jgi:hypothetical protein